MNYVQIKFHLVMCRYDSILFIRKLRLIVYFFILNKTGAQESGRKAWLVNKKNKRRNYIPRLLFDGWFCRKNKYIYRSKWRLKFN